MSASEEAGEKKGDLCLLFTLISDLTFERSGGVRGRERGQVVWRGEEGYREERVGYREGGGRGVEGRRKGSVGS